MAYLILIINNPIIPINNIFNIININFIWIGNPKYHLCLFLAEHFSKFRHAFWGKGLFLSKTMFVSHML